MTESSVEFGLPAELVVIAGVNNLKYGQPVSDEDSGYVRFVEVHSGEVCLSWESPQSEPPCLIRMLQRLHDDTVAVLTQRDLKSMDVGSFPATLHLPDILPLPAGTQPCYYGGMAADEMTGLCAVPVAEATANSEQFPILVVDPVAREIRQSLLPSDPQGSCSIESLDFFPSIPGRLFSGSDMFLRAWDCVRGVCVAETRAYADGICHNTAHSIVITGGMDEFVKFWDCRSLQHIRTLEGNYPGGVYVMLSREHVDQVVAVSARGIFSVLDLRKDDATLFKYGCGGKDYDEDVLPLELYDLVNPNSLLLVDMEKTTTTT